MINKLVPATEGLTKANLNKSSTAAAAAAAKERDGELRRSAHACTRILLPAPALPFPTTHLLRVVNHLHHLGMPRVARAHLPGGRGRGRGGVRRERPAGQARCRGREAQHGPVDRRISQRANQLDQPQVPPPTSV